MSGSLGWLDNLTTQIGTIAGKAVDVVGSVAQTQATQVAKAQTDPRATSATPVASAQVAFSGSGQTLLWAGLGVAVLVGVVLLIRKG